MSATSEPHFFEEFADFMGPAYLRYSFTKGTANEVAFLWDALDLQQGMRVLDVGCGPGRHALALAEKGVQVVGLDIAQSFIDIANAEAERSGVDATFVVGDARLLHLNPQLTGSFDAVVSLCQGGFGLVGRLEDGNADQAVLDGIVSTLKPGGRLALSAFSVYFQLQHLEPTDVFDATTGVNSESTEIRNEAGDRKAVQLHTTCFTPLELRLISERSGLRVDHIWSVTPGEYSARPLSIDRPEFLLLASKSAVASSPVVL